MHRLTREVRFAISLDPADDATGGANGFGGVPALNGLGVYFALRVTLEGDPQPASSYLCNIKWIDHAVRQRAIPVIRRLVRDRSFTHTAVLTQLHDALHDAWPGTRLVSLELATTPHQSISIHSQEPAMIRLSQQFEFSAAHRLHNPDLSDAENIDTFGKCNNPDGHGHNYVVQVTVAGKPDANGQVMSVRDLEQMVDAHAIEKLDHKHLNTQVPEFRDLNPSVENIAMVIYRMLAPVLAGPHRKLASVTVWETPKTWCEYSE